MSTNYYLTTGEHIGKLCGSGPYCAVCKRTLCKLGWEKIHFSHPTDWRDTCPDCGTRASQLGLSCSFSWAIHPALLISRNCYIIDEYNRKYSMAEFGRLIHNIHFHFYDSIGTTFG